MKGLRQSLDSGSRGRGRGRGRVQRRRALRHPWASYTRTSLGRRGGKGRFLAWYSQAATLPRSLRGRRTGATPTQRGPQGSSGPNMTGRVVQILFVAHKEPVQRALQTQATTGSGELVPSRRPQVPQRRLSAPRPSRPAPPTAAGSANPGRCRGPRRAVGTGLTSLRVGQPTSGALLVVGVVRGGPRWKGGHFTRGGSRGEAGPRAPHRPRRQNFPLAPALPKCQGSPTLLPSRRSNL